MVRRKDGDAAWTAIAKELRSAPIEFHPADRRLADVAVHFKSLHPINLAGAFAEIQGSKFGINASGGIVNQVSWIEQAFDNYNLGEFTPAPVS